MMHTNKKNLVAWGLIVIGLCLNVAVADDNHYKNTLIGNRASGMGGAYTAISDDPTGLFYNPAGIVYSVSPKLSASVNAYSEHSREYSNVLGNSLDWGRQSNALLPNYFGVIQPVGKGVLGFSYAVPESVSENQDQQFTNFLGQYPIERFVVNLNAKDNIYNIGPSYAYEVNDSWSVGATLYFHYRQQEVIFNQFVQSTVPGDYEWSNSYFEQTEMGLKPILGVMWSPADGWSLGASLTFVEVFDVERKTQVTGVVDTFNINGIDDAVTPAEIFLSDPDVEYPVKMSFGVASFPTNKLIWSADVDFYSSTDDKEAVVNFAGGFEYYKNSNLAIRGGFFTNYANTPEVSSGGTDQAEHIDVYGFSLSYSWFTRNSSITLGGVYSQGSGDAQVISGSTAIQDATLQSFSVYMSTSYAY